MLGKYLSKKVGGFKQYKNAQVKIAKFHGKQKNIKTDFMDKLSTKIISENQTIDFCRGIICFFSGQKRNLSPRGLGL